MKLSVVLPNYNHADKLPRALRALLRQELPPDEIIVVDDASSDASIGVIEALQREHTSIRLIRHETNRGAPAALNTGLAAAKGEYVYFSAADDFVLGGFFSTAVAALDRYPAAAYACAEAVLVDPDGAIVGFRPPIPPSTTEAMITPEQAHDIVRSVDNWAVGQTVVHRRHALVEIGGFDEALGSFCDGLTYRLQAFRKGFYFFPRLVAAWEVHPESLSARSAVSPDLSNRLIEAAKQSIARDFPPPLDREYQALFARRVRFSMARLALTGANLDVAALAGLVGSSSLDHRIVLLLKNDNTALRTLVLAWFTLRLRPFGFAALARAWLASRIARAGKRAEAARLIAAATR